VDEVEDEETIRQRNRKGLGLDNPIIMHKDDKSVPNQSTKRQPKPSGPQKTPETNPKKSLPTGKVDEVLLRVAEDFKKRVEPDGRYTEADIPRLRAKWVESCQDIMHGVPEALPPVRGVNHHITLIDDNKRYNYYLPRCPDALKTQLMEKITRYTRAGWWEAVQTNQAAPMLCIPKPKKEVLTLRTAIDCRQRNDNTVKDVTPLPDQDQIRLDVARAKVRSKIDFSDA
jgi:hypothetical protein